MPAGDDIPLMPPLVPFGRDGEGLASALPPARGEIGGAEADQAWIAVIQKMDETYAELVSQQVELEAKNAALEEAQGFIAGLLGAMTDVLVACDLSGRVEQVNVAAERAFGRRAEALVGRPLAELIAPSSPASAADVLATMASRARIADREFFLATPDGPQPVAVNGALRFDPRGRAVGIVLVGRPIGELRQAYSDLASAHEHLKRTQQQLVHAEKMASLGRLVAGVAHELNNPISFVYGNAHALKRYVDRLMAYLDAVHAAAPDTAAKARAELRVDRALADIPSAFAGMLEGAERVRDIVADLRRFSSDRREAREPFDLAAVVRSAVDWVAKSQMPDLVSHVDLPEEFETIGHPGHIHQVLMNLVQNAVDAMEGRPAPRLDICGSRTATALVLELRDSGPGIPQEVLGRVFDPFFTTKPVGKGTGLGLAICYRIAEEHDGRLTLENAAGGGAVATLTLPLAPARRSR